MAEDMTYEPVTDVTTLRRTAQEANQYALCMEDKANELAARVQELERALAQADSNTVALAARNAELAAAYQPVEKAMRRIWNAYSFGTAGTSIGEDFNHIKAWLDGVRVDA